MESLFRFAGTSSTAYPQGTQSGPPVHLAVPENCCGLTLILAVFDRCGNGALAFSATGSARASFPRARGRLCSTPRAKSSGCFLMRRRGLPQSSGGARAFACAKRPHRFSAATQKIPQAFACGMNAIMGCCECKPHSPFLSLARTMVKAGITRPRIPA